MFRIVYIEGFDNLEKVTDPYPKICLTAGHWLFD